MEPVQVTIHLGENHGPIVRILTLMLFPVAVMTMIMKALWLFLMG